MSCLRALVLLACAVLPGAPPPGDRGGPAKGGRLMYLYHAAIGTSPGEADSLPKYSDAGGKIIHPGGTPVLWVNGDPTGHFYTGGQHIIPLNQWLLPGRNELTFSGKHRNAVYVKVPRTRYRAKSRRRDWDLIGFVGAAVFPGPGGERPAKPLVFRVGDFPRLPQREPLGARREDRARYDKEVRGLVEELKGFIRKHKGQEAVRLLTGGASLRRERAYGELEAVVEPERLAKSVKFFSHPKTKLVDEERALRLRFGKRAVLAYVEGVGKDREPSFYTLAVERKGERRKIGPLVFARVPEGRWVVWDTSVLIPASD